MPVESVYQQYFLSDAPNTPNNTLYDKQSPKSAVTTYTPHSPRTSLSLRSYVALLHQQIPANRTKPTKESGVHQTTKLSATASTKFMLISFSYINIYYILNMPHTHANKKALSPKDGGQ